MRKEWLLIPVILFASCSLRKTRIPEDVESKFNYALELFEKGKYSKAAEIFKDIVFSAPTSEYVDKAQYYLAKSYKEGKDYEDAILEYQFLITTFPTSKYTELAYIELAECYLLKSPDPRKDQKDTWQAIKYAKEFLARYPDSPHREQAERVIAEARDKLAQKFLYIAETYKKLGYYDSAILYIENLLKEYPDVPSAYKAKILLAEIYFEKKDMEKSKEIVSQLLKEPVKFNDKKYKKKLDTLVKKLSLK